MVGRNGLVGWGVTGLKGGKFSEEFPVGKFVGGKMASWEVPVWEGVEK